MTRLDPIFSSSPADPGYYGSAAYLTDEIESLEADIASWERDIRDIEKEIPKLEIEKLTKQRDVAIYKLRILELTKKLEAR